MAIRQIPNGGACQSPLCPRRGTHDAIRCLEASVLGREERGRNRGAQISYRRRESHLGHPDFAPGVVVVVVVVAVVLAVVAPSSAGASPLSPNASLGVTAASARACLP
jgi:hypothetical protein